ncbi:Proprotein convertase subtilisin/kexin type 7 [Nowakowskiella sp. JEL0078]|nr:Proprotein convertase subtilisin/kexin type 7 [Nowakowskiella sp. JEL0078]
MMGALKGRNGRGSIFVFASGNGGAYADNCNFDGYANSIYTISIGAIDPLGKSPHYAELCSAHLAVTYSGGSGLGITTTDINGKCTSSHSGTSAAAPIASGIIALVLSVRPDLHWRDIQYLIVKTALKNDPFDDEWKTNGAGYHISHKYGFGSLDALAIVEEANIHQNVPTVAQQFQKSKYSNSKIPLSLLNAHHLLTDEQKSNEGLIDTITLSNKEINGIRTLEHVQVTVRLQHPQRRYLRIVLISPSQTESILATERHRDFSEAGFNPWTFTTVRCWGENPEGTWTLKIRDSREGDSDRYSGAPYLQGELLSWELVVFGICGESDTLIDEFGKKSCSQIISQSERIQPYNLLIVGVVCLIITASILWWKFSWKLFASSPRYQTIDLESPVVSKITSTSTGYSHYSERVISYFESFFRPRKQKKEGLTSLKKSWSTDMIRQDSIKKNRMGNLDSKSPVRKEFNSQRRDSDPLDSPKHQTVINEPTHSNKGFDKRIGSLQKETQLKSNLSKSRSFGQLGNLESFIGTPIICTSNNSILNKLSHEHPKEHKNKKSAMSRSSSAYRLSSDE